MSLSKPLALIMHTVDIISMGILLQYMQLFVTMPFLRRRSLRKFTERTRTSGTPFVALRVHRPGSLWCP